MADPAAKMPDASDASNASDCGSSSQNESGPVICDKLINHSWFGGPGYKDKPCPYCKKTAEGSSKESPQK
ncbi:uncharacterized protein G6M90_00g001890 [Metarhizium brunneum]|uniref:Uncharacterized protein n=1 Tax=Metarhizium brunneum TaxID=500148 RepID=A0A7D5URR7_9HYPO|nr:hypothetical protein G6M90_00g001890 [Metarhizium brunneum]